ncbi:MAG TPA: CoA transferase [Thermodesulfobacteriota bacterium]|nr:CoA transferase [Thermodesulfobacteriota bacterium]
MEDYFSYTAKLFNPSETGQKPEVLKGVRVLDFSHVIFGPTATRIMANYGAEVIKLELPFHGDLWRPATYWGKYWKHSNPLWHFVTQNKYFVGLDLKQPEAKEIIYRLAQMCDVVAENFAPGTAEAWGVGYTQISKINPKVIYLSCSTYGQYGPLRFYPGWDLLAQAASGVLSSTGYPDTEKFYKLPDYLGDFIPGNFGALAILMALYFRNKTGKGQYIDLAQSEALMRLLFHFTTYNLTGIDLGRTANADPTMVPASIFKTRDGKFMGLACATDQQFKALCGAMGREDLLKEKAYTNPLERLKPEHAKALTKIVADWLKGKGVEEVVQLAKERSFPAAEVLDDYQIYQDPWRRERGSVILFNDEMYGEFVLAGPSAQLSKTPSRTKWIARPVGYHNRLVLKKFLEMSEEKIGELEKKKVVGTFDDRPGLKPPVYYNLAEDPTFNYGREVKK